MLLLNDKQRKWASYACLTLGASLALNTAWRSLVPPEVLPTSSLQQIQSAMRANEEINVNLVTKPYLNTLLLKMIGASGLLGLAAFLSPRTPKTLEPDPAEPAPPPDDVSDEVHETFLDEFKMKLAELVRTMPWLIEILKAQIVVVVGVPGTGKSSVAQSLALIRLILFAADIDIVDPDWDNNVMRKTWLCGQGIGSEERGAFREQLSEFWQDLRKQTYEDHQGHTVILDEISKWVSTMEVPTAELEGLIKDLYQTFRRKNIWSILLLHGLQQEYNLGTGGTAGTLTNVYEAAGIIRLTQKKSKLGEATFSAVAEYKPPGQHPKEASNWRQITIPPAFHAANIIKLLGEGAKYFGVGLSTPTELAGAQTVAVMRDLLDEAIPANADLVGRLHRITQAQIQPGVLLPEEEMLPDLTKLSETELKVAKDLQAYLGRTKLKPDDEGFHPVRDIWRCWARDQRIWSKTEDFKTFLAQLEGAGVGRKKQEGRKDCWRFLKGFHGGKRR